MAETKTPETYDQKLKLFQAMAQLDSKTKEIKSARSYSKAYLLSTLIPPLGLYFFVKYALLKHGTEKNVKAGTIAIVLTIVSLLLSLWLVTGFFNRETSIITPEDTQILEDFMNPKNQKELLQLFR